MIQTVKDSSEMKINDCDKNKYVNLIEDWLLTTLSTPVPRIPFHQDNCEEKAADYSKPEASFRNWDEELSIIDEYISEQLASDCSTTLDNFLFNDQSDNLSTSDLNLDGHFQLVEQAANDILTNTDFSALSSGVSKNLVESPNIYHNISLALESNSNEREHDILDKYSNEFKVKDSPSVCEHHTKSSASSSLKLSHVDSLVQDFSAISESVKESLDNRLSVKEDVTPSHLVVIHKSPVSLDSSISDLKENECPKFNEKLFCQSFENKSKLCNHIDKPVIKNCDALESEHLTDEKNIFDGNHNKLIHTNIVPLFGDSKEFLNVPYHINNVCNKNVLNISFSAANPKLDRSYHCQNSNQASSYGFANCNVQRIKTVCRSILMRNNLEGANKVPNFCCININSANHIVADENVKKSSEFMKTDIKNSTKACCLTSQSQSSESKYNLRKKIPLLLSEEGLFLKNRERNIRQLNSKRVRHSYSLLIDPDYFPTMDNENLSNVKNVFNQSSDGIVEKLEDFQTEGSNVIKSKIVSSKINPKLSDLITGFSSQRFPSKFILTPGHEESKDPTTAVIQDCSVEKNAKSLFNNKTTEKKFINTSSVSEMDNAGVSNCLKGRKTKSTVVQETIDSKVARKRGRPKKKKSVSKNSKKNFPKAIKSERKEKNDRIIDDDCSVRDKHKYEESKGDNITLSLSKFTALCKGEKLPNHVRKHCNYRPTSEVLQNKTRNKLLKSRINEDAKFKEKIKIEKGINLSPIKLKNQKRKYTDQAKPSEMIKSNINEGNMRKIGKAKLKNGNKDKSLSFNKVQKRNPHELMARKMLYSENMMEREKLKNEMEKENNVLKAHEIPKCENLLKIDNSLLKDLSNTDNFKSRRQLSNIENTFPSNESLRSVRKYELNKKFANRIVKNDPCKVAVTEKWSRKNSVISKSANKSLHKTKIKKTYVRKQTIFEENGIIEKRREKYTLKTKLLGDDVKTTSKRVTKYQCSKRKYNANISDNPLSVSSKKTKFSQSRCETTEIRKKPSVVSNDDLKVVPCRDAVTNDKQINVSYDGENFSGSSMVNKKKSTVKYKSVQEKEGKNFTHISSKRIKVSSVNNCSGASKIANQEIYEKNFFAQDFKYNGKQASNRNKYTCTRRNYRKSVGGNTASSSKVVSLFSTSENVINKRNHHSSRYDFRQSTFLQVFVNLHEEKNKAVNCGNVKVRSQISIQDNVMASDLIGHDKDKFVCYACDYSSRQKTSMIVHTRRHTGEKPFKCSYCEYSSVEQSHVKRHTKLHTGDLPHQCPHCSYACIQKISLRNHLNQHHLSIQQ